MNITESVTRLSNLDLNDSMSAFQHHAAQQFHGAYEVFYNFIAETKPARILEIGTALGGFTTFLKICCDELQLPTKILSYDIANKSWYDVIRERGIDIRVENVFTADWSSVDQYVVDFIKDEGTTIVLCDGGYKIGEFRILSDHLKSGDFILAHDYARDKEFFKEYIKGRVWNWCEITDADIQSACDKNNLKAYNCEVFETVAWCCKQK